MSHEEISVDTFKSIDSDADIDSISLSELQDYDKVFKFEELKDAVLITRVIVLLVVCMKLCILTAIITGCGSQEAVIQATPVDNLLNAADIVLLDIVSVMSFVIGVALGSFHILLSPEVFSEQFSTISLGLTVDNFVGCFLSLIFGTIDAFLRSSYSVSDILLTLGSTMLHTNFDVFNAVNMPVSLNKMVWVHYNIVYILFFCTLLRPFLPITIFLTERPKQLEFRQTCWLLILGLLLLSQILTWVAMTKGSFFVPIMTTPILRIIQGCAGLAVAYLMNLPLTTFPNINAGSLHYFTMLLIIIPYLSAFCRAPVFDADCLHINRHHVCLDSIFLYVPRFLLIVFKLVVFFGSDLTLLEEELYISFAHITRASDNNDEQIIQEDQRKEISQVFSYLLTKYEYLASSMAIVWPAVILFTLILEIFDLLLPSSQTCVVLFFAYHFVVFFIQVYFRRIRSHLGDVLHSLLTRAWDLLYYLIKCGVRA